MKTSTALVKLIIFMIVTSMLTLLLAATIGNTTLGGKTSYKAEFRDVTGLLAGNDVRIAGVKVGKIDDIELDRKKGLGVVSFSLEDERRIPESTIVRLRYRNIVGERYLALTEGPGSAAPLKENALIPAAQTRDALDLTVLFNGFKPLFRALDPKAVNDLSFEIIKTLQGEGGTVESLMARTASLTNTLADRDQVIGRVLENLTTVLATIDDRSAQFDSLIVELRELARGFAGDRQAIGESLDGINNLTSATAGLLGEIRAPLRTDIKELGQLAATLDDEKETVDGILTRLPDKLNTIANTATHGSFFNFYLCGIRVVDAEGREILPPQVNREKARCYEE